MYPITITINNAEELDAVIAALNPDAASSNSKTEPAPEKEKPAKNKPAKTTPVPTREDINALTLAFIQVNGEGRAREILKSFNAARVSKVKDEDLQAYHDALKSEMPE